MIAILDLNTGNIGSVYNMIKLFTSNVRIVDVNAEKADLMRFTKLVIPGVGAFDRMAQKFNKNDLRNDIIEFGHSGRYILGICLGMQVMFAESEEGDELGLGLIKGKVKRFEYEKIKKSIPNMGWRETDIRKDVKIVSGIPKENRYYFVHSYYCNCDDREDILMTSNWGIDFVAAIQKENVIGTQFHPEKSLKYGKIFMKNFVDL